MDGMEKGLLVVLGYFLGVVVFIYVCFKIYQLIITRKSRHYRDMLAAPAQTDGIEMQGDYVLVTASPVKPHLFGRSYKYKAQDYEHSKTEEDHENKSEVEPSNLPTMTVVNQKTTQV